MVEIREEPGGADGDNENIQARNAPEAANDANARKPIMDFIKERPSEVLSFGLRLATFYFMLSYILPISNPQFQRMAYTKAFAAAAATNAFRLHQRLRNIGIPMISRDFLNRLAMEDSAHYIFYCLIMVMSAPITLALLPICIYAAFNIINFIQIFSNEVGYVGPFIVLPLVNFKQQHTANMLSTIACAEIFLLPILVMEIFIGKASLFTPFIYYRFLTMRYMSARNPYTRQMFAQLKLLLISLSNHRACPNAVRNIIMKFISLVERLAPAPQM